MLRLVGGLLVLALLAAGFVYRRGQTLLDGARASTRDACLKGGNDRQACDCVAEREWTSAKVRQFEDVLVGKEPATSASLYNKRYAEASCAEELGKDPRSRVIAQLTGECLDHYRQEFTEATFTLCLCVAQSVSTPEVVDAFSGHDETQILVQRALIGVGGLKDAAVVSRCTK